MNQTVDASALEGIAANLLGPLWRGVDAEYKGKYARNIWQQFEDNVRSAAYTSHLPRFIQRMSSRLRVTVRADDVARLTAFVASADGRATLKALREEATYLVLLVRSVNEERRAATHSNQRAS
jgi:hypothetical protein